MLIYLQKKVTEMLDERDLLKIAKRKAVEIFGKPYLIKNFSNTCFAQGMVNLTDNTEFYYFQGIKGHAVDNPSPTPSGKGWTVYIEMRIDALTGNINHLDYKTDKAS